MSLDDLVATHENKLRRNPLSRWHFLAGKFARKYLSIASWSILGLGLVAHRDFKDTYTYVMDDSLNVTVMSRDVYNNMLASQVLADVEVRRSRIHSSRDIGYLDGRGVLGDDEVLVGDGRVLDNRGALDDASLIDDTSLLLPSFFSDVTLTIDRNFHERFYNQSVSLPTRNVPLGNVFALFALGSAFAYIGVRALSSASNSISSLISPNTANRSLNQSALETGLTFGAGTLCATSYLLHGSLIGDESFHVSAHDAIPFIASTSFYIGSVTAGMAMLYDIAFNAPEKSQGRVIIHAIKNYIPLVLGKSPKSHAFGEELVQERVYHEFVKSLSDSKATDEIRLGHFDELLTHTGSFSVNPDSMDYGMSGFWFPITARDYILHFFRPKSRKVLSDLGLAKIRKDFYEMPYHFSHLLSLFKDDSRFSGSQAELHALHARWVDTIPSLLEKHCTPLTRFEKESLIGMKQAYEKMYDLPSGLSLSEVLSRVSHHEWGTAVALAHEDKDASRIALGSSKNEVYTLGRNNFLHNLIVVKRFTEPFHFDGALEKVKELGELVQGHRRFSVPRVRYHLVNGDEGFAVCEFVHGKTLSEVDTFEAYKLAAEYVAFIHDTMDSERGAKNYRSVARERIQHAHSSSLSDLDKNWGFVFDRITSGYVFNADSHPQNWLIGGEGDDMTASAIDIEDMGLVQPEFDMVKLLNMMPHSLSGLQHDTVVNMYCDMRHINRGEFMKSYLHAVIPGAVGFSLYSHEHGFATPLVRVHFLEKARFALYELNTAETRRLDRNIIALQNTLG
ncbi:MAG: phosphotransferase [Candidatus Woesearchaeota archaeon]